MPGTPEGYSRATRPCYACEIVPEVRMPFPFARVAIVSFPLLFLVACGSEAGEEDGGPPGGDAPAGVVVTPEGGTFEIGGIELEIPADALAEDTTIDVVETTTPAPDEVEPLSSVYEFAPDGLLFARPITVRFPYVGDEPRVAVHWSRFGDDGFDPRPTRLEDGLAETQVTHFSWGMLGVYWTLASATPIECSMNAQGLGGDPGSSVVVTCPAGCGTASVWGTGVYSDDSSVCAAAIHSGATTSAGGTVLVVIEPGQPEYVATTSYGVSSSSWGSWSRSFIVLDAGYDSSSVLDCSTAANVLMGDVGETFFVACPAGCTQSTIWGTGIYSDDSAICTAAIHAGVITSAGGDCHVTIAPGQPSYVSTTQNGITSESWGQWERSFTVSPGE